MKAITTSLVVISTLSATAASAGNSSSNSSSNSSNGVHTRVDTIMRDDGRGRRVYEERIYRQRTDEPRRYRSRARDDFDD
jgi:hypothetical protein